MSRSRLRSNWSAPSAAGSRQPEQRLPVSRLLNRERALHALLAVVADVAVDLVRARLEVDGELAARAGLDRVGRLLDAVALDLEVVDDAAVVLHVERDAPRLGGGVRGIERKLGLRNG